MRRDGARARALALMEAARLADEGRPDLVLPMLLERRAGDPSVGRLRLWRVDQAVFNVGHDAACGAAARAAAWCGVDRPGGYLTLDWVLDRRTRGARLTAWLFAMTLRQTGGRGLSGPDPYRFA